MDNAIKAKEVIAFRVQRRTIWDSDARAHVNHVLQALIECDGYSEWTDVPLVNEDGDKVEYR